MKNRNLDRDVNKKDKKQTDGSWIRPTDKETKEETCCEPVVKDTKIVWFHDQHAVPFKKTDHFIIIDH
jgi:hypothetical protein